MESVPPAPLNSLLFGSIPFGLYHRYTVQLPATTSQSLCIK